MAGTAPWLSMKATIGFHASRCPSVQMPVSRGLIRPSGLTAVASVKTMPLPPVAEVDQMPVGRHAVLGEHRVLAHRGGPQAVAGGDAAQGQGVEKRGHVSI
jgi:hypothetical protein